MDKSRIQSDIRNIFSDRLPQRKIITEEDQFKLNHLRKFELQNIFFNNYHKNKYDLFNSVNLFGLNNSTKKYLKRKK